MIKAVIMFIFGNTFWEYLINLFGSTEAIIEAALLPLAIAGLVKYFKKKSNQNNEENDNNNFSNSKDNNNNDDYYFKRGFSEQSKGNYAKAIPYLEKAVKLNPNDSIAYAMLGHSYRVLEQYKLAIKNYEKALELNPEDDNAGYFLKECLRKIGKVYNG